VFGVEEKGIAETMVEDIFPVGSRVRVTSYSPFRGLKGTIRTVDTIAPSQQEEEPFCFYKIALEGAQVGEPIWFEYDEVELVASPSRVPLRRG
jgi:hypothetical protein